MSKSAFSAFLTPSSADFPHSDAVICIFPPLHAAVHRRIAATHKKRWRKNGKTEAMTETVSLHYI